jgi:hypothetical protein
MAVAVYYDDVTGKVTRYEPSAHTPAAIAAGALINPDLSAVSGVPVSSWRVVGGNVVNDPVLPDLDDYKNSKLAVLESEVSSFLDDHYDANAQLSLLSMHSNATGKGASKANRKSHVESALDWVEAVLSEYATKAGQVMVAVDHAGVDAIVFDWSTWLSSNPDPGVTIASALAIGD